MSCSRTQHSDSTSRKSQTSNPSIHCIIHTVKLYQSRSTGTLASILQLHSHNSLASILQLHSHNSLASILQLHSHNLNCGSVIVEWMQVCQYKYRHSLTTLIYKLNGKDMENLSVYCNRWLDLTWSMSSSLYESKAYY